jgi:hypothetical protein
MNDTVMVMVDSCHVVLRMFDTTRRMRLPSALASWLLDDTGFTAPAPPLPAGS